MMHTIEAYIMKTNLWIITFLFLLCSCADTGSEPTGIDTALDAETIEEIEPAVMTAEARAETSFDTELFATSVDQLLYMLPVTRTDVIDELGIILEGQTGATVDLQTIRTCMTTYSDERLDAEVIAEAAQQARVRWSSVLDETTTNEAVQAASLTFAGCVTADQSTCYQGCEAYAAAASTIAAIPYINRDTSEN